MTTRPADDAPEDPPILVAVERHVATVTLNRPRRLNAFTPRILEDLDETLRGLDADPTVRVVVLTGAGRAFCAGGDVNALAEAPISEDFVRDQVKTAETLYGLRPITIAAVNGACAGGGMALACATDIRVAARSAFFYAAYLGVGNPGDLGLPWHLTRLVGLAHAKAISLLGERIPAARAHQIGLVERVVDDESLLPDVATMSSRLAAAPSAAFALKENLNEAMEMTFSAFLDVESRRFAANARSADSAAAVQAFLSGRRTDQLPAREARTGAG